MAELDAGKDSLYFIGEKIGEQDFRMIMTCCDNGHPVFCRFEQMVVACLACDKHIRAGACRGFDVILTGASQYGNAADGILSFCDAKGGGIQRFFDHMAERIKRSGLA